MIHNAIIRGLIPVSFFVGGFSVVLELNFSGLVEFISGFVEFISGFGLLVLFGGFCVGGVTISGVINGRLQFLDPFIKFPVRIKKLILLSVSVPNCNDEHKL